MIVEWSTDGGETWPHRGKRLNLSRAEAEQVSLRARARAAIAPADDRYAYEDARLSVDFRPLKAPRLRIRSETLLEEGVPYPVSARVMMPYRGLDYDVEGFFTLPDGSTVEGDSVDYLPTAADVEQETINIGYTAWIKGYRAQTEATATQRVRVWQYVWPHFYVLSRRSAEVAPAEVSMSVRHRSGTRRLEEPQYEWRLPREATDIEVRGEESREFRLTEPGTYTVEIAVSDARGHETVIEEVIELAEPDPFEIDLRYSGSNGYQRAPYEVRLRPRVRGGHPNDRVRQQRFLVNGEVIAEDESYAQTVLQEGAHSLTFEIVSAMGIEASKEVTLDVAPNQPPVCELDMRESDRDWAVTANCEDADGRVRDYEWLVDGELAGRTSYRLSLSKRDYEQLPDLSMQAIDDGGARSAPARLN